MPKVTFTSDNKTIEVPAGSKLVDVVEQAGATLPFGCRLGSCGTCRCIVVDGMDNINPLTEAEHDLFSNLTSVGKQERLGCQIVVNGDVSIQS
ncbi:MAG: (2Fe-2S)-binding protein [Deltaproteobacteria bacterium]|nr:(2Fe-2S)-binding protein [Deltaproteobacteria bacterium]